MSHPRTPRIDEDAIRALPKAEVHVHLEGTFSLLDLLTLAKENGVALPGRQRPSSTSRPTTTSTFPRSRPAARTRAPAPEG